METRPSPIVKTVELVMPQDANNHGTMFGGRLLELLDKCAAITAFRFCGQQVVTASFESIDFHEPIQLADTVELNGRIIYTGRTSLVIRVDVYHQKGNGPLNLSNTAYTVFVAVDDKGRPTPVPQLEVRTDEEKKAWEYGKALKDNISKRLKHK